MLITTEQQHKSAISSVQSPSRVRLFVTPWIAAISICVSPTSWAFLCPHPTPLGLGRAPSWAPCVIWRLPTSCLLCTGCTCGGWTLSLSCPLFPLLCPKLQSLHQHLYPCPANRYHFSRFCRYALTCSICFSLFWPASLSMTDSRLIHITTNDPVPLLFMAEWHSTAYTHTSLCIALLVDV